MATIQDVAAQAGVSTASVSRYLAGAKVRSAVAIQDAIDDLQYQPNVTARSLRSGRHRSIGVIVPDLMNPFFSALVKGIEQETRDAGYHVLLGNSDEDAEQEQAVVAALGQRVDGILAVPIIDGAASVLAQPQGDTPVVLVDRELPQAPELDCVLVDNESGARQAVDHLVRLGHERIAYVSGPLASTPGRDRYEGFVGGMASHGLPVDDDLVAFSDFKEQGGYDALRAMWQAPSRPTAVFVGNNLMTQGALNALTDLGVRIPDEVSIIGFDDLSFARLLSPPLSVIRHPEIEQGAAAARVLLSRLAASGPHEAQRISLPVEIVVRGSTSSPAAETAAVADGAEERKS